MSWPWIVIWPSVRAESIRSFRRLRQRSSVVLPQPLGPMNAVVRCGAMRTLTSNNACFGPYQKLRSLISMTGLSMAHPRPDFRANHHAGEVQQKSENDQHEHRAVQDWFGALDVRRLRRKYKDMIAEMH